MSLIKMESSKLIKQNTCQSGQGIREIRKVTLSLGLLSTPNRSLSGMRKVQEFYEISV
jgi:hypothetical protein